MTTDKAPRKRKSKKPIPASTADRPITEFMGAGRLAKRLGISKSRLYVLARENRLTPPPEMVDDLQLFHESTTYTRKIVNFVDAPAPQPHS